jgi:hypothetical protein
VSTIGLLVSNFDGPFMSVELPQKMGGDHGSLTLQLHISTIVLHGRTGCRSVIS